jgi:hypothetical protein
VNYRITGLDPAPFLGLCGLSEAAVSARGVTCLAVESCPGCPDRIELRDARPGETALLLDHVHHDADSPYRASQAIYVREGARERFDRVNEVPPCLRPRILSLRSCDARHRMLEADLVDGRDVEALIERLLANADVAYLHAHNAKAGCFAARIDRVA